MLSLPAYALPRSRPAYSHGATRAFTLIELLMVIALIGILAAIMLSVMRGVKERAAIGQSKAELSVLATALESYKRQYGDYPQTGTASNDADATSASASDGPGILFNALTGKRGPKSNLVQMNRKATVELGRFTLQDPVALPDSTDAQVANAFVDPWGQRYLYYYKTGSGWISPGYVLVSVGPDKMSGIVVANTGTVTSSDGSEDNLYADR